MPAIAGMNARIFVQSNGIAEVSTLQITAGASSSSNVTVTLDGVAQTVAVTSGDTITQVANKVKAASFSGWTTGGSGDTITFTSNTVGLRTDAIYSAGTTGATGTISTTVQGAVSGAVVPIGSMKDVSIDISQTDIDVTSLDSSGWDQSISGTKSWTVSSAGFFVDGDAGQDALNSAMLGAAPVNVEFYRDKQGASGAKGYKGTAVITKWGIKAATGGAVELSVDMKGNGPLVATVKP